MDTRAEYRILRNLSGMSSREIAREFDFNVRTVQRWETDYLPPDHVLEYLRDIVSSDTAWVAEMMERAEIDGGVVRLSMYRVGRAYYESMGGGDDVLPVERYRARVYRLASALMVAGYEIDMEYVPEV